MSESQLGNRDVGLSEENNPLDAEWGDELDSRIRKMKARKRTSDLIIETSNALAGERSYEAAMTGMLELVAKIIRPKRLRVFERGERTTSNTFEWCAEGVEPQMHTMQEFPNEDYESWYELLEQTPVMLVQDVESMRESNADLYDWFTSHEVKNLMSVPFYSDGKFVGYLGVDNFELDEGLDTEKLLEFVSSFAGARIANRRLMEDLRWSTMHDDLTGLLNRHGADLAVSEALAQHTGEPYVVALLDIDDFKRTNDVYGHQAGDMALRTLGRTIRDMLPENAIVARHGGDEFFIMLYGEDAERADELLKELSDADVAYEYEGESHRLSTSIGYASYPDQADSVRLLSAKADAALYAVKLAGKADAFKYSLDMESQYRSQLGFTPREIAESVPGGMMVHKAGGEGDILFANDELIQMFECDGLADFMEYTGGTFRGIMHPDDRAHVYEDMTQQSKLDDIGSKNFSDFRIVTKTGAVKNVFENGRLVDVEGIGLVFYVLMIDRDERDRKMGEVVHGIARPEEV